MVRTGKKLIKGIGLCAAAGISFLTAPKFKGAPADKSESSQYSIAARLSQLDAATPTGVRTGYIDLDDFLGAFPFNGLGSLRGGDLVILAARPAIGKTALAINIAIRAAMLGTPVAFFSLEIEAPQLTERMLAAASNVGIRKIQTCNLHAGEPRCCAEGARLLSDAPLYIDDTAGISVSDLQKRARRLLRDAEPGKGLIIVDCFHLMRPQHVRSGSYQFDITETVRKLKSLATKMGFPVIITTHLTRSVELRPDKRPRISDLGDLESIAPFANFIMLLDRSLTLEEASRENRPDLNVTDVIIAQNRRGPTGVVSLCFRNDCNRFENLAGDSVVLNL